MPIVFPNRSDEGAQMARLFIGTAVAAVIVVAKLVLPHPAMPDTLQGREEFLAQGVNKAAPIPIGPYGTMTGAKVSDGTLEVNTSFSSSAPKITVDDGFRRGAVTAACRNPIYSDLLKRGGRIRFVITAGDGTVFAPVTIAPSDCPSQ